MPIISQSALKKNTYDNMSKKAQKYEMINLYTYIKIETWTYISILTSCRYIIEL